MLEQSLQLSDLSRDPYGKPIIPLESTSLFRFGHLVRSTERLLLDLFSKGLLSGTTHTCLGQELCQMSVVRALDRPGDAVLSNHRNHGHFLTYSGDFLGLVAEIMGRANGVCRGIGGSQHLAYRHFHSNGVQAGMTAIGAGLALSRKLRGDDDSLVACFIGDGTLGEGLVYEAMNLASVWRVPMLFVVEHNGIAQTTFTKETIGGSIIERGKAFGLACWQTDDSRPEFCREVDDIVRDVRSTRQPAFLVIDTERLGPHSKGDDLRDAPDLERIASRDPLARLGETLPPEERAAIEAANGALVEEIREAASLAPESRFETQPMHHFHETPSRDRAFVAATSRTGGNVRSSLNAALRQLLEAHPDVLLLGEDLHDPYGGAFKVTSGLSTAFPGRVVSTPISEAGIVGAGIGLALAGYRPIVEIMFADFIALAMDQLYNHAVKFPGMFESVEVPLVVRTPAGGRRGYGPTHSQSPEHLLAAIPGLTVVYGSHRHNVGALLCSSVLEWPYPTVFLEHKLLYGEAQDEGDYMPLPASDEDPGAWLFPSLARPRTQPDLTIVAYGGMLPVVERAAAALEAEDLVVEIVAPALLHPLPRRTLCAFLSDKPCVAIVEEAPQESGFGAELAATLAESGFHGRLKRFGTPPVPIPAARSLEAQVLLDEKTLFSRLASFVSAVSYA